MNSLYRMIYNSSQRFVLYIYINNHKIRCLHMNHILLLQNSPDLYRYYFNICICITLHGWWSLVETCSLSWSWVLSEKLVDQYTVYKQLHKYTRNGNYLIYSYVICLLNVGINNILIIFSGIYYNIIICVYIILALNV